MEDKRLRKSYLIPEGFPEDLQRLAVLVQVFSDMDSEEIERDLDYLRGNNILDESCEGAHDESSELLAIKEARKRKVIVNVQLAYGDESLDETAQRVFAASAVLGNQYQWDSLIAKWKPRTGDVDFHATDCQANQGDYKKTTPEENTKLYTDLTQLLVKSSLSGFGFAVSLADFKEIFPGTDENFVYYKCFGDLIASCANLTTITFPMEYTVKFTFDISTRTNYTAGKIYSAMVNDADWKFKPYLHPEELSFACKKTVGIQVADLVARESMKRLDNVIGPKKRPTRLSYTALANTGRFWFRDYQRSDLLKYKERAEEIFKDDVEPYKQWLSQGRIDSMANRLMYLAIKDSGKLK